MFLWKLIACSHWYNTFAIFVNFRVCLALLVRSCSFARSVHNLTCHIVSWISSNQHPNAMKKTRQSSDTYSINNHYIYVTSKPTSVLPSYHKNDIGTVVNNGTKQLKILRIAIPGLPKMPKLCHTFLFILRAIKMTVQFIALSDLGLKLQELNEMYWHLHYTNFFLYSATVSSYTNSST